MEEPNAHFWKDRNLYHCLLFSGDRPGQTSLEFRAPTWPQLKQLMREHGYKTDLHAKEVKRQWRMPSGDMWLSTG